MGINEVGDFKLPDFLKLGFTGDGDIHSTVVTDGHVFSIRGNVDVRLKAWAVGVTQDQVTFGVDEEVAATGVGRGFFTTGDIDLEETVAVDHDIKGAIGLLRATSFKVELRVAHTGTQTDIQASGALITVLVFDTRLHLFFVEQVFEVGAGCLETSIIRVRQIIGDHVNAR